MKAEQLKDLLDQMTLDEKIAQLVLLTGEFYDSEEQSIGPQQKLGISKEMVDSAGGIYNVFGAEEIQRIQTNYLKNNRNGIPLLILADIIYGYKTVFPIPLALGSTWDPELVGRCMEIVAKETSSAGIHGTFSPMVDLVRDARWGRVMESNGEDPFLNAAFAASMVNGFQGDDLEADKQKIASCVKHFAGYGAPEGGREYNTVDMSERRLRQDYLPSYKAAVDSGCEMVMTSFNTVDGVPATGNKWLLRDLLREEWGFEGTIISDYAATQELIMHGLAKDEAEAARLCLEAGVDMDMKTTIYSNNLNKLVESGEVSVELVNEAVWRILKLKNKLGLFEDPIRNSSPGREKSSILTESNRQLARETAAQSLVLLKNDDRVLPLSPNQKVSLIGPYADERMVCGMWAIQADYSVVVPLKDGMQRLAGDNLLYAKGCDILEDYSILGSMGKYFKASIEPENQEQYIQEALQTAGKSDVIVLALGEHVFQSGEGGSRTDLSLPKHQLALLDRLYGLNKPIVLLLFTGRPLVLTDIVDKAAAIVQVWYPGTETGNAIADVLYGVHNFSGRLSMSFPRTVGQIPVYYSQFSTGRPLDGSTHSDRFVSRYLDSPNSPLYPFGYGMSYTTFAYSDVRLSNRTLEAGGVIQASASLTNTGEYAGYETVQMYIQDLVGSVVRPVKELKGFKKVFIEPGETAVVAFEIREDLLRFYSLSMEYKSEPGEFKVYIGADASCNAEQKFELI